MKFRLLLSSAHTTCAAPRWSTSTVKKSSRLRLPEQLVPLATTTGWNFRAERIGNPNTIVALTGSYIPFARTAAERKANGDPRPSIEERYKNKADYLARIRAAAAALVKSGFMLDEDVERSVQRAATHWEWAMTR